MRKRIVRVEIEKSYNYGHGTNLITPNYFVASRRNKVNNGTVITENRVHVPVYE